MNCHFVVPDDFDSSSVRLDSFVASQMQNMNRSHLKSSATEILLNGKKSKLSAKIKCRDVIDIVLQENVPTDIAPENILLEIVYEDQNVTVVNKARGMVTHPAAGNWSGTLVNALLYHWQKQAVKLTDDINAKENIAALRPGIVHRLDKDTSGIIITAKNRDAQEWLSAQFSGHHIKKEYLAIVCGRPKYSSGEVRTHIVRDPKNRKRFIATDDTNSGKFARTIYHCVACYGNYSIMRLRLKTGRTHQIRVHLKYLGCPILGDPIYAKKDSNFPDAPLMLHSRLLSIRLPADEKLTTFVAPLPADFLKVHKSLKNKFQRIEIEKKHGR